MSTVIFACVGNSGRSQMAEAWAKKLADYSIKIMSAGTKPAKSVASLAVQVMQEVGIDISQNKPKLLTTEMVKNATHFISMGCGVQDSCPVPLVSIQVDDWDLEDPKGKDLVFFRQLRDQIKEKVQQLLTELRPK